MAHDTRDSRSIANLTQACDFPHFTNCGPVADRAACFGYTNYHDGSLSNGKIIGRLTRPGFVVGLLEPPPLYEWGPNTTPVNFVLCVDSLVAPSDKSCYYAVDVRITSAYHIERGAGVRCKLPDFAYENTASDAGVGLASCFNTTNRTVQL